MSEPQRDLWPDDIAVTTVFAPVAILREQARLLAERTKGLLQADVSTATGGKPLLREPRLMSHHLSIRAPALDNYELGLLEVRHTLNLYPVEVLFLPTKERITASSEQEFISVLGRLLSHPETKKIIHALLAQIEK